MKSGYNMKDLSSVLYQYRCAHSFSQEVMAELCGVSTKYYQRIERGGANVGLNIALYIAKTLSISLDKLAISKDIADN